MQTARFGGGNIEGGLELGIQDIEEAICEAPEEEEDGDQSNGKDGLSDSKSRSACQTLVGHALALLVGHCIGIGGCSLDNVGHVAEEEILIFFADKYAVAVICRLRVGEVGSR